MDTRGRKLPYKAVRRIRPPKIRGMFCRRPLERPVERPYDMHTASRWAVGFS